MRRNVRRKVEVLHEMLMLAITDMIQVIWYEGC